MNGNMATKRRLFRFEQGEYDYLQEKIEPDDDEVSIWEEGEIFFVDRTHGQRPQLTIDILIWNYDEETRTIVLRMMPNNVHIELNRRFYDVIYNQIKAIRSVSGKKDDIRGGSAAPEGHLASDSTTAQENGIQMQHSDTIKINIQVFSLKS